MAHLREAQIWRLQLVESRHGVPDDLKKPFFSAG
jgi:hypothetical protein